MVCAIEEMGRSGGIGQFIRTFVFGLAGATTATLGLFAQSLADDEISDEGRGNSRRHQLRLRPTTDWREFPSDLEVIAMNLPPIQFDNRERDPARTI